MSNILIIKYYYYSLMRASRRSHTINNNLYARTNPEFE